MRLLTAILLLAACDDVSTLPKETGSGTEDCCFFECDDGENYGWVNWPVDAAECEEHANTQCGLAGAGVSNWDFVTECTRCDDC